MRQIRVHTWLLAGALAMATAAAQDPAKATRQSMQGDTAMEQRLARERRAMEDLLSSPEQRAAQFASQALFNKLIADPEVLHKGRLLEQELTALSESPEFRDRRLKFEQLSGRAPARAN